MSIMALALDAPAVEIRPLAATLGFPMVDVLAGWRFGIRSKSSGMPRPPYRTEIEANRRGP